MILLRPCGGGRLHLFLFLPESSACLSLCHTGGPCEEERGWDWVNPDAINVSVHLGAPAGKIWTQLVNHLAEKKPPRSYHVKNRWRRSNGSLIEFRGSNPNQANVRMTKHNAGGILTNQTADPLRESQRVINKVVVRRRKKCWSLKSGIFKNIQKKLQRREKTFFFSCSNQM